MAVRERTAVRRAVRGRHGPRVDVVLDLRHGAERVLRRPQRVGDRGVRSKLQPHRYRTLQQAEHALQTLREPAVGQHHHLVVGVAAVAAVQRAPERQQHRRFAHAAPRGEFVQLFQRRPLDDGRGAHRLDGRVPGADGLEEGQCRRRPPRRLAGRRPRRLLQDFAEPGGDIGVLQLRPLVRGAVDDRVLEQKADKPAPGSIVDAQPRQGEDQSRAVRTEFVLDGQRAGPEHGASGPRPVDRDRTCRIHDLDERAQPPGLGVPRAEDLVLRDCRRDPGLQIRHRDPRGGADGADRRAPALTRPGELLRSELVALFLPGLGGRHRPAPRGVAVMMSAPEWPRRRPARNPNRRRRRARRDGAPRAPARTAGPWRP